MALAARSRSSTQQTPLTLLALAAGAGGRLGALPHAARPRGAHGRRESRPRPKARASTSIALRIGAIVAGSALMGVGGAFLTLSAFNAFFFNMVNGRGWICVALVVFASLAAGQGAARRAAVRVLRRAAAAPAAGRAARRVPYQVFLMLPYVLSILALVWWRAARAYPQALMKPYRKGER